MQTQKENKEGGELAKVLAILLHVQGGYSYIDKLSQSASKDLALYHIREALRDYNSLLNSGRINNPEAINLSNKINFDAVNKELAFIRSINSLPELRETLSYISASALTLEAKLKTLGEYSLACKALNYLRSKGVQTSDPDKLSEEFEKHKDELSQLLEIDVSTIESIAQNMSLMSYLIKRGEE